MVDAPRDFAGKDLRNRSFRGQDLRGADFSGSNLRGCDFREANLVGASFERAEMGQSNQQVIVCLVSIFIGFSVGCFTTIHTVILNGNPKINFSGNFAIDFLAVFYSNFILFVASPAVKNLLIIAPAILLLSLIQAFTKDQNFNTSLYIVYRKVDTNLPVLLISGMVAGAIICLISEIINISSLIGNRDISFKGLLYFLTTLIFLGFTAEGLLIIVKGIRYSYGTFFQRSNLTKSTFWGSQIRNTDFSNAKTSWVDWETVKIDSLSLKTASILELELNRITRQNESIDMNFENRLLNDAFLRGSNLRGSNLSGAKLQRADFRDANLTNVKAVGTDFAGADFTGAIIQNWAITKETNFEDVRCDYIYLREDKNPQSRKPLSGYFSPGDFAKVVRSFTETLDFLLHAHDDPQAFVKAMQEMMEAYGPELIQPAGFEHLGDGDRLFKFAVAPGIDPAKIHAETTERKLELEAAVQTERAKQLEARLADKDADQEKYLKITQDIMQVLPILAARGDGYNIHVDSLEVLEMSKQNIKNTGGGDVSGVAGGDIRGVAGKDIQGAAGRDLSGQVMLSIESLRQSDIPEAPTLADLLSQLKAHIDSSDLPPETKTAAQSHIEQLAKAPTMPTPEGIKEAADKSISFFKAISLIIPSLSSAINGLLGQITALLG